MSLEPSCPLKCMYLYEVQIQIPPCNFYKSEKRNEVFTHKKKLWKTRCTCILLSHPVNVCRFLASCPLYIHVIVKTILSLVVRDINIFITCCGPDVRKVHSVCELMQAKSFFQMDLSLICTCEKFLIPVHNFIMYNKSTNKIKRVSCKKKKQAIRVGEKITQTR